MRKGKKKKNGSIGLQEGLLELERLKQTMDRFLPQRLMQLLDAENYNELHLGKQIHQNAVILTMDTVEFKHVIHRMETKEIFRLLNDVYSIIVPIISKYGIVNRFANDGLTALFVENREEALNSALLACKAIMKENKGRLEQGLEQIELSMGVCEGPVMVGVLGSEDRMEVSTLSEYTGLSFYLQQLAKEYRTSIIASSTFLDNVVDAEKKYDYRFIGYLYLHSNEEVEKLYDVFEGDLRGDWGYKKKTKILFERGIELYTRGDYEDARLHFIEVLKKNRMDLVAKKYLNLCEGNIKQRGRYGMYFETY